VPAQAEPRVLEHFQAKWTPVRVKKMRYNKDLETFSDSMGSENALGDDLIKGIPESVEG
jgi:hypothetical protein